MANTTIGGIPNTLPAFDDTVLFETEWNPGGGPIGYKATAQQLKDYITGATVTGVQVYVDSTSGVDAVGGGSASSPYLTISFALSQITDATPAKLYNINASGNFSDTDWFLKPNISYDFNSGSYSVTNGMSLDASYSAGGNAFVRNISALDADITLDFDLISAAFSLVYFDSVIFSTFANVNVIGSTSQSTVFICNSVIGLSGGPDVVLTDTLGGFLSGSLGSFVFNHNSDSTANRFSLTNITLTGDFTINDSTAVGMAFDLRSVAIEANASFISTGAGTLNTGITGSTILGTVTVNGSTSELEVDTLENPVVFTNGASAVNLSVAARYAVSGGTGITYNPTDGIINADTIVDVTSYGEMYFQGNGTATVIAAPATPVKVNATYLTGDLLNFTQTNGTLTYTGATPIEFSFNVTLSAAMNLVTGTATAFVYVDGIPVAKSAQPQYLGPVTDVPNNITLNFLLSITTGQTIEIFIQNDLATDDITVISLNSMLTSNASTAGPVPSPVVISWDGSTLPVNVTAGQGITITGGVISAVGGPGGETLQQAYNNGNTIFLSANRDFSIFDVSGNEVFTQSDGTTVLNRAQLSNGLFILRTQANPSAIIVDYQSDLINFKTIPVVSNNQRMGGTLCTVQNAKTGYATGGPELMWNTISGTNTVEAGTYKIGSTIEIDFSGKIIYGVPSPGAETSSYFTISMGSLFSFNSNDIIFSTKPTSNIFREWQFRYKIVRTGATSLFVSGLGNFIDTNNNSKPIIFSSGLVVNPYNELNSYNVEVNFASGLPIVGGNVLDFIASTSSIKQTNAITIPV